MNRRKILVTGGAGFIGSHLVDRLLAEGRWSVTVVDNFNDSYSPIEKRRNLEIHKSDENFKLERVDICDRAAIASVFDAGEFDTVVHLAARAGVRPSLEMPVLYATTNVTGTLNVLDLARRSGIKQFVFASSSSVYGANNKIPFSEDDSIAQPISPYAATKAAGELLCHTYAHLYDIRCVALRFFTVYGPRQRPDLAIRKFAEQMINGEAIAVYGDGSSERDYTYVDDIVSGIRAAIEYDKKQFDIFNLGGSKAVALSELIHRLETELGIRAKFEFVPQQPGDLMVTYADIDKAKSLLGYRAKTGIKDGIRAFASWLKQEAKRTTIASAANEPFRLPTMTTSPSIGAAYIFK